MRPRKNILDVDDNELRQSLRKYMIEIRGLSASRQYRVLSAASALDAIEVAKSTEIDVVLAYIELDGFDGRDAIAQLKKIDRDIPMLLLSSTVRPGSIAHPADDFLGKGTYTPADLIERLRIVTVRKTGPKKKQVASVSIGEIDARRLA